jgi:hypothetical protein
MGELARGTKVFEHAPVRGTWRVMEGPDDVLDLMDRREGVIVRWGCGATFLSPIFDELAGSCARTPEPHGIVSRGSGALHIAAAFAGPEPANASRTSRLLGPGRAP